MAKDKTKIPAAAGRPRVLAGASQMVALHLERDVCERIDRFIQHNAGYRSRSDLMREAIHEYLAALEGRALGKGGSTFVARTVQRKKSAALSAKGPVVEFGSARMTGVSSLDGTAKTKRGKK